MPLDPETIAVIEGLLTTAIGVARKASPILTRDEAMEYTKNLGDDAFYRWCKRMSVRSVTNGRYSRPQLDRAMERESRKARFASKRHRPLKKAA